MSLYTMRRGVSKGRIEGLLPLCERLVRQIQFTTTVRLRGRRPHPADHSGRHTN